MSADAKLQHTLFDFLTEPDQNFLTQLSKLYPLSHQELRELCEIAKDLEQWREGPLEPWWGPLPTQVLPNAKQAKQKSLHALREKITRLKAEPTQYDQATSRQATAPLKVVHQSSDKKIHGLCPVFSEDTVCCNLHTIDAVENCGFGCSYCTIQSFYPGEVRFDQNFADKLKAIEIDPNRFYHFGTGQASDSLMWGNTANQLDHLCDFARAHPNVLLEFKTKSAKVDYFLNHELPPNMVLTWSLNTPTIIAQEEHGTARLAQRLQAARSVADRGIAVGFHFHPMVYYEAWENDYTHLAQEVMDLFQPQEVLFFSMGSLTFIKPVMKAIRQRQQPTKVLQMPMALDPKGKKTYPDAIKIKMYRHLQQALAPWEHQVYRYLCMEKASLWQAVFGFVYPDNESFEKDFGEQTLGKLNFNKVL